MLVSSTPLTPSDALLKYHSRNAIEAAFRDLKHGVDWRPARCIKPEAIKGRVLISFLAQLTVSFMRFRCPELRTMSSEVMISDLSAFSLTAICENGSIVKRIFSNFNRTIRAMSGAFDRFTGPNALKGRRIQDGSPS